ncbi:hypothetical protein [Jiulongibacter sp. NS-SX5]|uniref:hypothetical protein n=1 Tax=Jiulongibacter sp. NS-SX5 TaxID=3463854 RepID=UPI00405A2E43
MIKGLCLSDACKSQSVENGAKNAPNQKPAFAQQIRVDTGRTVAILERMLES